MIITFVSQCQKKSLKLTRQVLDTYAHRIGSRTWQAVMTEQGLDAVRHRLSKSARKTSAIACHRVRGTRRTELLWIVGNRNQFDASGNVPVHRTRRDLLRESDENDWNYLELIKGLVGVAGLWHDFGKAWQPFQKMLAAGSKNLGRDAFMKHQDPIRHEWISMLLFLGFTRDRHESEWLGELSGLKDLPAKEKIRLSKHYLQTGRNIADSERPLNTSLDPPLVRYLAWLIVSHHRLPTIEPNALQVNDEASILRQLHVGGDYQKQDDLGDLGGYWNFKFGLPFVSPLWCKSMSRYARKLKNAIQNTTPDNLLSLYDNPRLPLTLARTALMLGDHEYSSKGGDSRWRTDYAPVANTYRSNEPASKSSPARKKGEPRQFLDEHLVKVTDAAVKVSQLLPHFEDKLPSVENVRPLRKPSPKRFAWQNRAVAVLRDFGLERSEERSGFFGVNMASTGEGKTFANAKIMDAVSGDAMRYCLALGLRTLTLQTGDEYRERLRLDAMELGVMIGSQAVLHLHQQRESGVDLGHDPSVLQTGFSGSESAHDLSASYEFTHEDLLPDEVISTIVDKPKSRQLLKCPILVCTIDHMMPAVESTRGGHQILPLLRLMSSDLVIDEVDDFDHLDMPAISRLVHLVGMLGRKVMISSATIPPAVAEGLFQSYQDGYQHFARFRSRPHVVTAFWADEFSAKVQRVTNQADYQYLHARFAGKRAKKLAGSVNVARRMEIRNLPQTCEGDATNTNEKESLASSWFGELASAAIDLHHRHHTIDPRTEKRYSLGVIRLANVDPCIDMAHHLFEHSQDHVSIRVITYHARQVLLLRSDLEKYLDRVLRRKQTRPHDDPIVARQLRDASNGDVMFVVVASPVAEVGRDHDYDWAVVEPSSMRSIIQMAGRVRRHRETSGSIATPNVVVPDQNFKSYTSDEASVFNRPGYEGGSPDRGGGYRLNSHRMDDVVDGKRLSERLDAQPRIVCPKTLHPQKNLIDLEHQVLRNVLTEPIDRPAFARGWASQAYYLCDAAQQASPFRQSTTDSVFKLMLSPDGEVEFWRYDLKRYELLAEAINIQVLPTPNEWRDRLWYPLNYAEAIEQQQTGLGRSRHSTCVFLGELRLIDQDGNVSFDWDVNSGAHRNRG
ncbi:type I-F CRISPR-associated helicase Cas3f [Rhodopirellula europaea]|uniref:type I-F CRISPR-associated helicase Cas3f n=1 Tax=Rhodopirellula europaea TaxID=1263866 RepID=UPI003D2D2B4E